MATVTPFRGWRYNPEKIKSIASVLAPPYDVINETQHADYCARSPYNIVHLTRGTAPPAPDPYLSRYPQAADDLRRWRDAGILIQEEVPAIYVYEQVYETPLEGPIQRRGYIAAVKLHDYDEKVVLPHEGTRPAVQTDRLSLMRACQATFSPILALFSDPSCTVDRILASAMPSEPLFEVADDEGVVHRMWLVTATEALAAISAQMADKQIVIADGHHRYGAALAYRNQMQAQHHRTSSAAWEYIPMFLCNVAAEALTILPSHRLIRELPIHAFGYLRDPSGDVFAVSERVLPRAPGQRSTKLQAVLAEMSEAGRDYHIFGLYTGESKIFVLKLARGMSLLDDLAPDHSAAWRNLDLVVLHHIIIKQHLGLTGRYAESQYNILSTRSAEEAIRSVDGGESALAFLVNPPQVKDVMEVAIAGDRMPQKGTYFYPKPLAGIAIYDLTL